MNFLIELRRTAKPVRGQQQRSASIDFVTVDGARSAALACDRHQRLGTKDLCLRRQLRSLIESFWLRLEIEDQGETFVLSCSIRHKAKLYHI